jgi:hypothetical protein
MSGMNGVHQVRRRQRPQSAYVGTRKQSFGGSSHHKTTSKNATTTMKKIRPTTAKTMTATTSRRRKKGGKGGGASTAGSSMQQVYARMLKRQADLYRKCTSMERHNKEIDERVLEVERQLVQKRKSNAVYAANNFCNVRNAQSQHQKLINKRVSILEKQVLATKRRLSHMTSEIIRVRNSINTERKRQMIAATNVTTIENEMIVRKAYIGRYYFLFSSTTLTSVFNIVYFTLK